MLREIATPLRMTVRAASLLGTHLSDSWKCLRDHIIYHVVQEWPVTYALSNLMDMGPNRGFSCVLSAQLSTESNLVGYEPDC